MRKDQEKRPIPFVRKLCAHLSEEEILEAEVNLRRYIRLALQIHSRKKDELAENQPDLTAPCKKSKVKNPVPVVFTGPRKEN